MIMWDIKLFLVDFFFSINCMLLHSIFYFLDLINPFFLTSFSLINWQIGLNLPQNLSLFFGFKFCLCISFLILIRGGTPRYRYDFLTKLGWLKFLSLILLVLIFSLLFYLVY
uniref:Nad1_b n=1 Tax=Oxytricha trifallax TaxID=1172189 RepID=G9HRF3_9SPIT|nr:nad1_b [Oxytricha trifallax]